jgi:hypothetical protein
MTNSWDADHRPQRTYRRHNRPDPAGLLLIVVAAVYFATAAGSLPAFFPGHKSGSARHHTTHGIAVIALAILCWSGPGSQLAAGTPHARRERTPLTSWQRAQVGRAFPVKCARVNVPPSVVPAGQQHGSARRFPSSGAFARAPARRALKALSRAPNTWRARLFRYERHHVPLSRVGQGLTALPPSRAGMTL